MRLSVIKPGVIGLLFALAGASGVAADLGTATTTWTWLFLIATALTGGLASFLAAYTTQNGQKKPLLVTIGETSTC